MAEKAQILSRTYNILDRFIVEQPMNADVSVYSNFQPLLTSPFLENAITVDVQDLDPGMAVNTAVFQISVDGGASFGVNGPDFDDGRVSLPASMTGTDLTTLVQTITAGSLTLSRKPRAALDVPVPRAPRRTWTSGSARTPRPVPSTNLNGSLSPLL